MVDYVLKIVLLGEGNVGKTSLVYRYIENRFSQDFKSTLGVNLLKKKVALEDEISGDNQHIVNSENYIWRDPKVLWLYSMSPRNRVSMRSKIGFNH